MTVAFDTAIVPHQDCDYEISYLLRQAISSSDAVPLVRVPWNEPTTIMRMLDAGVCGVIAPMINSRVEAERFVGACRYPPNGFRSYGPIRANLHGGDDYFRQANNTVITLAMIETVQALDELDKIVSAEGLDGVYIGMVDLSISMGLGNVVDFYNSKLKDAVTGIVAACAKHHRVAGIHAQTKQTAATLSELGIRLITPVNDSVLLRSTADEVLRATRRQISECSA
jgi:4-hydroxy-2-oxoheptanedioate aldolase